MSHLNKFILQCHDNLISGNSAEINDAKDYLFKRGITPKTIDLHKMGYCPYSTKIPREVIFYGKDLNKIDKGDKGFAYFIAGRIIVPIYSEFNHLVGLATRKPSTEPGNSWWNISKPFHKSEHLFLLDKARKSVFKNNKIYLVEGYIDAIILMQEGLDNVVGLMGINLSPRQIGLIARYCNNICLCLDVDLNNAGQKAQGKSIYYLKKFDFHESISVVDGLPVKVDPDDFVIKNGIAELLKLERKMTESETLKIYKEVAATLNR